MKKQLTPAEIKAAQEKAEKEFQESIKDLDETAKATVTAARAQFLSIKAEMEANMISKEDAEEMSKKAVDDSSTELKAIIADLKQKTVNLGTVVTGMKATMGGSSQTQKTFIGMIEEKMEQIKAWFEGGHHNGDLVISTKAAVAMTTANATDYSALDGTEIDNFRLDAFVPKRQDREYIFDIADRTTVQKVPEHIIWEEEGDTQGAVAIVSESGLKPLLSFEIVENKSKAKKAVGKIIVTTEFDKFKARKLQIIKGLFNDKLIRDYQAILTADLVAGASSYIGTTLDGTIPTPNDYDAIGAVAAQLEVLNFSPDVLIINPQDKWRMALTKDADGGYVARNIPVLGANGQVQFMNFRTITSNKIAAGTAILGEGNCWKIEEEAVTMRMGSGVTMNGGTAESDFDYNRIRIIGEVFFHSYIPTNHAGSFVLFDFEAVKAGLEAVAMV
jgi:hypothetical protein